MLHLLADENFNGDIVRGLIIRRSEMNIVRVQDVGLIEAEDPDILEWAAFNNYIILTHDRSTMPNFAFARIGEVKNMPGVFIVHNRLSIRQAIDEILFVNDFSQ